MKWLKNIIINIHARSISQRKLQTAAVLRNETYLHWAYAHGNSYLHPQIIDYLADIKTQTNYAFLLSQIKKVKSKRKKVQLYTATLNVVLDDKVEITRKDEIYLQQHLYLIDGVKTKTITNKRRTAQPLIFRDKLQDHLKILEEMKKRNSFH